MQKDKTEEVHYMVERIDRNCFKAIKATVDKRGYLNKEDIALFSSEMAAELLIRDLVDKKDQERKDVKSEQHQKRKKAAKQLTLAENVVS